MLAQETHVIPHASMAWLRRRNVKSKRLEIKDKRLKEKNQNQKPKIKQQPNPVKIPFLTLIFSTSGKPLKWRVYHELSAKSV
jgi:hypothetical protein